MGRKTLLFIVAAILLMFVTSLAFAKEDKTKTPPTKLVKQAVEKVVDAKAAKAKKPAKVETKALETAPSKADVKIEEALPSFPIDSRKIKITIKMKNGKIIKGVVKHFLISTKVIDHIVPQDYSLSDGPVVSYKTDEFGMSWDKIKKIDFNSKNKENGEISCYEESDKSPDRWECLMINQYALYSKDKSKKGKHIIQDRNMFRFVVKTSKGLVSVESHLGKIKVTNERDEARKMKELQKELNKVFADAILWIKFN